MNKRDVLDYINTYLDEDGYSMIRGKYLNWGKRGFGDTMTFYRYIVFNHFTLTYDDVTKCLSGMSLNNGLNIYCETSVQAEIIILRMLRASDLRFDDKYKVKGVNYDKIL